MPKKDSRLIIYEKMTQLIFYSKNLTAKFPKSERFDNNLKNVIYAWKEKDIEKRVEFLTKIDVELYILKTMTRLAYEYKYITPKNYMVWNEKIAEIGKMVGGWLKACQKE